jgi:uncharacterized protein (DUF1810 family)
MENDINHFISAQDIYYQSALSEIKAGYKSGHWMWFIFPQIKGLGSSSTAEQYAIKSQDEATEYLNHKVLGYRLIEITKALLEIEHNNAYKIFGTPDDLKLKSCMTLFSLVDQNRENTFVKVLDKYFEGERCHFTVRKINN